MIILDTNVLSALMRRDANRVVVLYPQVKKSLFWPVNPRGCWDWWGYSGADYAARTGAQPSAIRRMLDALGAT